MEGNLALKNVQALFFPTRPQSSSHAHMCCCFLYIHISFSSLPSVAEYLDRITGVRVRECRKIRVGRMLHATSVGLGRTSPVISAAVTILAFRCVCSSLRVRSLLPWVELTHTHTHTHARARSTTHTHVPRRFTATPTRPNMLTHHAGCVIATACTVCGL
jgi:hypothetical protein